MKTDHRLLDDLILDDAFAERQQQFRPAALAAFRRARFIRRAGRVSAAAAIVALSFALLLGRAPRTSRLVANPEPAAHSAVLPAKPAAIQILTDQELLDAFPPGACFLAQVGNREVLVFKNDELRSRFLR